MIDTTLIAGPVQVATDTSAILVRIVGDDPVFGSASREWHYGPLLQTLLGGVLALLAGFVGKLFEQRVIRGRKRDDFEELVRTDIGLAAVTARQVANELRTSGNLLGPALDHMHATTAAIEAGRESIALLDDPSVRMALTEWLGLLHVIRKGTQEFRDRLRNAGPGAQQSPEYQQARGGLAASFNLIAREGAFIVEMLGGAVTLPVDPPQLGPSYDPKAAEKETWRAGNRRRRGRRSTEFIYRINQ